MKTATITFHAAHNYGSMLQAYALQQTLLSLGIDNEIINFRSIRQKELYCKPLDYKGKILNRILRFPFYFPVKNQLNKKYNLFEQFLKNKLILTQEFNTPEELKKAELKFDYFISGGDQIWNVAPIDFDWSYYLNFVKEGKKISYGVSMGPNGTKMTKYKKQISQYLSTYDAISVREEGTRKIVEEFTNKKADIVLDPTLLLSKSHWETLFNKEPIYKEDYIFMYVPMFNKDVYEIGDKLSKLLQMNVVVSNFQIKAIFYKSFIKKLDVGPLEFLNLISNAKLVISGSFHATVFAIIFHTPFFSVNGDKDNRTKNFLQNLSLESRTINLADFKEKSQEAFMCDFSSADNYINDLRTKSLEFIKHSIK